MRNKRWRLLLIPLVVLLVLNVIKLTGREQIDVRASLDEEEVRVRQSRAPKLRDGVYRACGDGFSDKIHVEMTVEKGAIQSLYVYDHNEHETNGTMAVNTLPGDILSAQSVDIDVVSGATETSRGIIEATKNCIRQAGGNPADF